MRRLIMLLGITVALAAGCSASKRAPFYTSYDRCPVYPEHQHVRMHGRKVNPENCNFFGLFGSNKNQKK